MERGSLLNDSVRQLVRSLDWPKHFQIDSIEHLDREPYPHIAFYVFKDNMRTFGPDDIQKIEFNINMLMSTLRGKGVPCFLQPMQNRAELDAKEAAANETA
jgi:hypothetical protein